MDLDVFVDWLGLRGAPYCEECLEATGEKFRMEPDTKRIPRLQAYAPIWECPECGRQVYRKTNDDVELTTPDGERF